MSNYKEIITDLLPGYRHWECQTCKGRVHIDKRELPPVKCPHCGRNQIKD